MHHEVWLPADQLRCVDSEGKVLVEQRSACIGKTTQNLGFIPIICEGRCRNPKRSSMALEGTERANGHTLFGNPVCPAEFRKIH